ncbi:MAG: VWA domain-containing protein, partial [Pyrinomonadaceae bacterium]|nr:VWA domain-containing protein [Pyrinomonadaceae bacterium]
TVPVSVSDREGRFIADLKKEDFQISENGKPQEIAYFGATEMPFTVALVLDVSLSASFKIDEIQTAAFLFVKQLRPNDRVLVISFDEQVHFLCEPTNDREKLRLAINQARFGQGTSLYNSVKMTFDRLKFIEGRKAIVLFTDGVDTTSRDANDGDNLRQSQEFDALVYPIHYDTYNDVQRIKNQPPPVVNPNPVPGSPVPLPTSRQTIPGTNIPLPQMPQNGGGRTGRGTPTINDDRGTQTVGDDREMSLPGDGTSRQAYANGKQYLDKLAMNTGGRVYEADSKGNLANSFTGIAEELRRQYSLGYYPETSGKQGERRAVKVRVNRPKAVVRARGDYVVGKEKKKAR